MLILGLLLLSCSAVFGQVLPITPTPLPSIAPSVAPTLIPGVPPSLAPRVPPVFPGVGPQFPFAPRPGVPPYNPYYNTPGANVPILSYHSEHGPVPGTYSFSFATGDGKQAQESGFLKDAFIDNAGEPQGTQVVQGSYSYVSPEGTPIQVSYVADENGFRPAGVHIPADGKSILPPLTGKIDEKTGQLIDPLNRYNPYNNIYGQYNRPYDPKYPYDPRRPYDTRRPFDARYPQDPRYPVDPRYPQDPRYPNDARYPYDPRYPYDAARYNNYNPYRPYPYNKDIAAVTELPKPTTV